MYNIGTERPRYNKPNLRALIRMMSAGESPETIPISDLLEFKNTALSHIKSGTDLRNYGNYSPAFSDDQMLWLIRMNESAINMHTQVMTPVDAFIESQKTIAEIHKSNAHLKYILANRAADEPDKGLKWYRDSYSSLIAASGIKEIRNTVDEFYILRKRAFTLDDIANIKQDELKQCYTECLCAIASSESMIVEKYDVKRDIMLFHTYTADIAEKISSTESIGTNSRYEWKKRSIMHEMKGAELGYDTDFVHHAISTVNAARKSRDLWKEYGNNFDRTNALRWYKTFRNIYEKSQDFGLLKYKKLYTKVRHIIRELEASKKRPQQDDENELIASCC
jgi:hypothetical protein